MFKQHPDSRLVDLFAAKPYQGVEPHNARFLFVGLDANYADDVASSSIFPALLEYHEDAPAFWRHHGVHHPFLLPGYSGDGRRYHRNFGQIGFSAKDADQVSFLEMLHVPTTGRSSLEPSDLASNHMEFVRSAIFGGVQKHVFVSDRVLRLMKSSRAFSALRELPSDGSVLPVILRFGKTAIYKQLHFSVYGKFEARRAAQVRAISLLKAQSDSRGTG